MEPSSNVATFREIKVLDHGHVSIYDAMANDLSVVNSARISFDTRHDEIDESDRGLINYLMKNKHGTPFEHNSFIFDVKAPIFVLREWHRHRIGISINEMSARYTELPNQWYVPNIANVRVRVGKPGHYKYESVFDSDPVLAQSFISSLDGQCTQSYEYYKWALARGVAPEQARLFLHVNHYSHMFWTCNARSLMNFLALRNAPTAQWEIQQYAQALEGFFTLFMPITYDAFVDNGRVAP